MEDVDCWIRFSGYRTSNDVDRPPPQHYLLFTATPVLP